MLCLQNKDYRDNQALYFLTTGGSFRNKGSDELNFSGTIAERLNGIVNGIFTNEDGKFNLGLNYEAGENRPDYRTDGRFGVTLQTQISDKVLINGKVGVPVGSKTQASVVGEVKVEILLNEDGNCSLCEGDCIEQSPVMGAFDENGDTLSNERL